MNTIHKRAGVAGADSSSTERIEIRTLDDYCANNGIERVNFLKVDVEGHELAVFEGARRLLDLHAVDFIQFEYGGCNLDARVYLLDIWECLAESDYRLAKVLPGGVRPLVRYEQSMETFRYCNFVAYSGDATGELLTGLHS